MRPTAPTLTVCSLVSHFTRPNARTRPIEKVLRGGRKDCRIEGLDPERRRVEYADRDQATEQEDDDQIVHLWLSKSEIRRGRWPRHEAAGATERDLPAIPNRTFRLHGSQRRVQRGKQS